MFSYDIIGIPVHLSNHWTCGILDFQKRTIEYCDSMHSNNALFFKVCCLCVEFVNGCLNTFFKSGF